MSVIKSITPALVITTAQLVSPSQVVATDLQTHYQIMEIWRQDMFGSGLNA